MIFRYPFLFTFLGIVYIAKGTLLQAWCIQLSNLSNKFATPIANFLCNILPLKVVLLGFMHYKRNIIEGDPKKK